MSSCINYNPIPPRVWSRVQNRCSTDQNNTNEPNDVVYIPLTKQYVTPGQAQFQAQLLAKGNILQYKVNSANFSKKQNYARISNGYGSSRKKCFASQSETVSNPNTSSLLRVNYINVPYPNQIVGAPNNISGPFQTLVPNPFDCSSNVIPDLGNLVCGTIVSPCSGEIIQKTKSTQLCYPSTCSDVPGKPIELCWYPNIQTWYPKTRYTMNNSGNKWPVNYKAFVSAIRPVAPVLTGTLNSDNTVSLNWTATTSVCTPISNWRIFNNETLIENIPYPNSSTVIYNLTPGSTNSFYVIAFNGNMISPLSNIYTITIPT
jgi:hypothetical protein